MFTRTVFVLPPVMARRFAFAVTVLPSLRIKRVFSAFSVFDEFVQLGTFRAHSLFNQVQTQILMYSFASLSVSPFNSCQVSTSKVLSSASCARTCISYVCPSCADTSCALQTSRANLRLSRSYSRPPIRHPRNSNWNPTRWTIGSAIVCLNQPLDGTCESSRLNLMSFSLSGRSFAGTF